MAKKMGILVCILVMVLDIVAGILGIEAEIAQHKVERSRLWISECRDPSSKTFKLGLVAAILLCLAHTIANLLGGCICVRSKEELDQSSANKHLALMASLILSWIIVVIAFSMLIARAMANSDTRKDCGLEHYPLLCVGGVLCFVHGLFSVAYIISANAIDQEEKKLNRQGSHA